MERFFYSHWPYPFPLDFNFQHLKNRYLSYIWCYFQGFRAQIFIQLRGIRQLQGCWRCDVGGAHTLSSANWGLQHSSSRSPYIANLLKRSYKTLYNQFRIGRISIFNRYYQNTRGTLSEIVDFRFQTSEIRRTRKTNTSTGPTGLE